jgi:hypothetical protein
MFCRASTTICGIVICHATTASIGGVVIYCAAMALSGIIVCHAAMAKCTIFLGRAAMAICGVVFGLTAMGIRGDVVCHATSAIGIAVFCRLIIFRRTTSANFGDRCCRLPPHHFGDTQQLVKKGMCREDASNRDKATGNNQPAQHKDERGVQHKRQRNNSNTMVVAMVTSTAVATMATTVAAVAAKSTAAHGMVHAYVGQKLIKNTYYEFS